MTAVILKSFSFWQTVALTLLLVFLLAAIFYGTRVPGRSYRGQLEPLSETERGLRETLRGHVEHLAGTIGERNVFVPAALDAAAHYLELGFAAMGYAVREQAYTVSGRTVKNLEVEILGGARREEIVVIGAHYDSVAGSPGANDNASGVAALLELARWAKGERFARTVRFVAFVNEEPPFFTTGQMGSQVYAHECRRRGENLVAMLSLETLGYFSDAPGSQAYPAPFGLLYPSTANFVAFVGNFKSRALLHQMVAAFRQQARFPSEGAAAPEWIAGIGWSDHWSFWRAGYPGVMVTDTALFRYPHYHSAQDTPDKLDYDRLARVTGALARVVSQLASPPT